MIDENRPAGSIKIRIETIGYFLERYRERLLTRHRQHADLERHARREHAPPILV